MSGYLSKSVVAKGRARFCLVVAGMMAAGHALSACSGTAQSTQQEPARAPAAEQARPDSRVLVSVERGPGEHRASRAEEPDESQREAIGVSDSKAQAAPPEPLTEPRAVPQSCASAEAEPCLPPRAFAEGVCRGKYPGLALVMFEKRAPWQRLYVKVERLDAVNAYEGPRSEQPLEFGEEVLLLKQGGAGTGGIQISGPNDVDVLRWDGTCATIRRELLVTYVPGVIKRARLVWKYLGEEIQNALLQSPTVARTQRIERQRCRGSSVSNPSAECQEAITRLNEAIAVALLTGLELPEPRKLPRWADR